MNPQINREILLERVQNQTRLAVLEKGRLCEIYYERGSQTKLAGNIYAARVQNVLPGMNAAFVDIGLRRNGFLYAGDICFDTRDQQELKDRLESARIERMLRPGQSIVVQVVKEPGGSKGPRVSGSITLPGRLAVLLPTIRYAGVSKKITDPDERDRLFAIAQRLSDTHGAGVIVRTAGEGAPEAQIEADYLRLLRMWADVEKRAKHSAQPRLIQADGDLALRAVRDMLDGSVTSVRTDDAQLHEALRTWAQTLTPEYADRIALHSGDTPLFDLMRVDHQLEQAFSRQVHLKSGGNLVIDETEAMTVIDVNTARFTGKKSLSETVFHLNCEAAEEIARQLRLRDIGGIVLIDFIDMDAPQEREALLEHLREALKSDRNRTNVLGMTALGLVEMTRKKTRQPLSRLLMRDCSACLASGREWTHESVAYQAVRELWRRRRMGDTTAYTIRTGEKVAGWIGTIGLPEGGRTLVSPGGSDSSYELLPCGGEGPVAGSEEEV
ncbi:MAG: Rne/Rng family ribonuclease [Aristaeellaceae bacterium]